MQALPPAALKLVTSSGGRPMAPATLAVPAAHPAAPSASQPSFAAQAGAENPGFSKLLGDRRTARFFLGGGKIETGPLKWKSSHKPAPLTRAEQGALLYAATGVTGFARGDLDQAFAENGQGNVMLSFVGSTAPSADSGQFVSFVIMDDTGTYVARPLQGYSAEEKATLIGLANEKRWEDLWNAMTVKIADQRITMPDLATNQLAFNHNVNKPGTTYFLPVADMSSLWLTTCFELFDEAHRAVIVDANKFLTPPPGLKKFIVGPQKGWRAAFGRLMDKIKGVDPSQRYLEKTPMKTYPSDLVMGLLWQVIGVELGARIQNIQLMSTELGLGSRPHFAGTSMVWGAILGFEQQMVPTSTKISLDPMMRFMLRLMRKDAQLPSSVGVKKDGAWVLKSYSPEVHGSVRAAVEAFVNDRFGPGGAFDPENGPGSPFKNPKEVLNKVPRFTKRQIEAVIAFNEDFERRYGTYPIGDGYMPVLHTATEVGVLDTEFYDAFYPVDTLTPRQRERSGRAIAAEQAE